MKTLRTSLFALRHVPLLALLLAVGAGFCAPATAADAPPERSRLEVRSERRAERQHRMAERATAATQLKVRAGKHPGYTRLLKSTSYELMYTEGLRYLNMKKRRTDGNSNTNLTRAQNLLDGAFQSQALVGTPREDSMEYYLGLSYYKAEDYTLSEQIFDRFRHRFGASPFIEDVEYMYAMGFYFASPPSEFDQSTTIRAMAAIAEYRGRYPNTGKSDECDVRIAELRRKLFAKSFDNARLYYTIGQYKAATRALGNAIDEYPDSPYREELMYLATKSAYRFAKNSVAGMMTDRYMSMMDNYYNLVSEFPETKHLREVEKMRDEARKHIDKHTKGTTETENNDGK